MVKPLFIALDKDKRYGPMKKKRYKKISDLHNCKVYSRRKGQNVKNYKSDQSRDFRAHAFMVHFCSNWSHDVRLTSALWTNEKKKSLDGESYSYDTRKSKR